jgi:hypothetical protein
MSPTGSSHVHENFRGELGSRWRRYVVGHAALEPTGTTLRFVNDATVADEYTNAQIDDYQGLARDEFTWQPPVTLTVRARFSHAAGVLQGTAGFGFWNDPFLMTGLRIPALPGAIWFFYASPPSEMKLDRNTPGHGWKAAAIDARRWPFYLLLPTAPLAIPLMNLRPLYRRLWPLAQRAMGVCEAALDVDMTAWHTYELSWGQELVRFGVDGDLVLTCPAPPRGPLGCVIWFDNQYAIVTPWGRFGYGQLATPGRQWMELDDLRIERGV